jgi:ABC-type branched-subunit amino acid transport system ATPase component
MAKTLLHIKNLRKSFVSGFVDKQGKSEEERHNIINNLNLRVESEKITALIGINGAGKTTLFNLISGFIKPDSGEILFHRQNDSIDISKMKPVDIAKTGIGRLFQESHIFFNLSVIDNMLVADKDTDGENPFTLLFNLRKIKKKEEEKTEKAKAVFADLFGDENDFWEKRMIPAGALSYGQQRLLGLARLFMGDYRLILLDEPTAGVNPEYIKTIIGVVKTLVEKNNKTVFLIEHNMNVVEQIADKCCFMNNGKIMLNSSPENVLDNIDIRKKYLGV